MRPPAMQQFWMKLLIRPNRRQQTSRSGVRTPCRRCLREKTVELVRVSGTEDTETGGIQGGPRMTNTDENLVQRRPRPRVAAAAARAAIEIREYDGRDVPDWLREVATRGASAEA